jgi:superfamily I DNA and/or RNA helicase
VEIFQGEEAKIVIVPLVRSNQNKKVGFLKKINRINVLLSRAQHGLCLIGNSETYSNIEIWRGVLE